MRRIIFCLFLWALSLTFSGCGGGGGGGGSSSPVAAVADNPTLSNASVEIPGEITPRIDKSKGAIMKTTYEVQNTNPITTILGHIEPTGHPEQASEGAVTKFTPGQTSLILFGDVAVTPEALATETVGRKFFSVWMIINGAKTNSKSFYVDIY
ncbi:MAG: hypothetical protein HQM09_15065 [Candidatus Riflebacteria bacterium]|nr:hypothetical protein [Candidatus Riflebacteria bacterium]